MSVNKDKVADLWRQGFSFGQIAAYVGSRRNVIAGIVHRMRVSGQIGYRTAPTHRTIKNMEYDRRQKIITDLLKPIEPPVPFNLNIMELKNSSCRYSTGVSPTNEWLFCGHNKTRGSYCEYHANLCYQPPRVD